MRNMKRWLLIIFFFVLSSFVVMTSFIYFFNVNEHSVWISKQVKKHTGYDIRFEHFENQWATEKRFLFSGVSLYQQQQKIAFIAKIALAVDKVDLWQRQLEIKSINLSDVDINLDWPLRLKEATSPNGEATTPEIEIPITGQKMAWDRLDIAEFNIENLNIALIFEDKNVSLKKVNMTLNELLIIDHQQLQTLPAKLELLTTFNALSASNNNQKLEINDVSLRTSIDLFKREGKMEVSAGEVSANSYLSPMRLTALELSLQLEQQKLSLTHFFVNAFSGSLAVKGDAFLEFNFLPKPALVVDRLEVLSLVAKDLQINIPDFSDKKVTTSNKSVQDPFPIQSLSVMNADLNNISILSKAKELPISVKSADVQINNYMVINNYQLIDPTQDLQQSGTIALAFEYLRWENSVIEGFSMESQFDEQKEKLSALKLLLNQ